FQLDLRTGELYKEGSRIRLQEQPYEVLALLIERPGQLVSREELRKKLWPNDTFVDFDHGLNIAISKLRDALGDSTEKPRFIETLPRHGYRFIAPLDRATTSPDVESRTPVTSYPATLPRTSSIFTRPWLVIGLFAVAILAILLATAIWKWS